jgi:hypothetical protein
MRPIAPIYLVLGLLLIPFAAFAGPGVGEVGSIAADFSLQDLNGATHTLSEHQNKVVLFLVVGWG